jgi:hypothetical protein
MDQPAYGDNVEIGRVLSRAFETIGRNPGLFLGLGVLLTGLPQAVASLFLGGNPLDPDPVAAQSWPVWVLNLLGVLGWAVLQASVVRATVIDLTGGKVTFGEALQSGIRSLLPVLAIAMLTGFGLVLGLLAFVIPGVILMAMWAVAVPAYVEERSGVVASFSRSRALTRGSRWKVTGLLLISFVILLLFSLLVLLVSGLGPAVGAAVSLLTGGISSAIYAAIIAALYIELRQVKDGTGVDELAEIFA